MTANEFRRVALSFPETEEEAHMGHPDFRVKGKIFATLGPDEDWGMVKLTPELQADLIRDEPNAFKPASGAWGQRGCTIVTLNAANKLIVRQALLAAW
ncbi:MAG: MmcQ/YjbR family DNA-binding protein [Planctomycetaceae bacterium]|nr:MmcQ/YjbR family DNA-binding protein [Planctomycetaceae bacterium]